MVIFGHLACASKLTLYFRLRVWGSISYTKWINLEISKIMKQMPHATGMWHQIIAKIPDVELHHQNSYSLKAANFKLKAKDLINTQKTCNYFFSRRIYSKKLRSLVYECACVYTSKGSLWTFSVFRLLKKLSNSRKFLRATRLYQHFSHNILDISTPLASCRGASKWGQFKNQRLLHGCRNRQGSQ